MSEVVSHLIAFLLGTFTGAASTYFGHKYTDRRRQKEAAREAKREFREVREMMPELVDEMKTDLAKPENRFVREFIVLGGCGEIFRSSQKRFVYYESKHEDLSGKVAILENHDYIIDITPGNTPIYRMTKEFVQLVLKA